MSRQPPPAANRRGLTWVFGAAAALLVLAGSYLWLLGGTAPPPSHIGGPFELTAGGQTVTERSFGGRYMLIYFGYASCPDVCPTTLAALTDALDRLGARADRLQPLFVTIDPAHDTPDTLRRYLAGFSPRLLGLTGTARQLRQMQQEYRVVSVAHPRGTGGMATFDHSSVLYLVAPDGQFVAGVRADATGADMAQAIATHIS